jgi:hypothetical protein
MTKLMTFIFLIAIFMHFAETTIAQDTKNTVKQGSGKRGVCVNKMTEAEAIILSQGVSWFYNWHCHGYCYFINSKARKIAQETMIKNNMRVVRDTLEQLAFHTMTDPTKIDMDDVFQYIGSAPSGKPSYYCMS